MPDFSLCPAESCPSARKCRRSPKSGTKPDTLYQTWAQFKPDDRGRCDYYKPKNEREVV